MESESSVNFNGSAHLSAQSDEELRVLHRGLCRVACNLELYAREDAAMRDEPLLASERGLSPVLRLCEPPALLDHPIIHPAVAQLLLGEEVVVRHVRLSVEDSPLVQATASLYLFILL
eukprot:scaffold19179_cov35-Tisochrysis_lutea.AAC.7